MGVMASCGCCYDRFCWSIVGVMVMGFVGFFWWWLAVGAQQRRERDVVGVEGREERDEEEDRERGEIKNFKNKIKINKECIFK